MSDAIGTKAVFAHFMVGNTYPYTRRDWVEDITLAHRYDIDGFVLNVGREEWQKDRVFDCFEAASQTSLPFKLFMSFDMSSIPGGAQEDLRLISDYIHLCSGHASAFRMDGKLVFSTFAGENCLFGQESLDKAWKFVKDELEAVAPVHFIPSFFIDTARYPRLSSLDGGFNWNGGWPLHLTPRSPRSEIQYPKLDTDSHHIRHLHGKTFMAAVSPWFFTHYGPDSWNKNWIYRGDDWLFARRWEQVVVRRHEIDIVQIISWNDYGESHYIGPIKGAQPNSQKWVDGYSHLGWLYITQYYARAFKDGFQPAVEQDRIVVWARPHPKDAIAPDDVPRPNNWELTDDVLWAVIFAVTPAIVTLSSGETHRSFQVPAGLTKLSHPLAVDGGIRVIMTRANVVLVDCHPEEFCFRRDPSTYNFNAFVATAP